MLVAMWNEEYYVTLCENMVYDGEQYNFNYDGAHYNWILPALSYGQAWSLVERLDNPTDPRHCPRGPHRVERIPAHLIKEELTAQEKLNADD